MSETVFFLKKSLIFIANQFVIMLYFICPFFRGLVKWYNNGLQNLSLGRVKM